MREFNIYKGSLQERFQQSRAKIQIFGGGFANGKTANAVIKVLRLARDYPGMNALVARSTYPKLNDTIRKEFIKWCPENWIQSFPKSQNSSNTCTLTNRTEINFRYAQQQGQSQEQTTSNLLSATYDLAVVDQIDDPEFEYKDVLDLLGRLRGSTPYVGDDPTMPRTGPRWMILTSNPTRNWFYRDIIKPLHDYTKHGRIAGPLDKMFTTFAIEGDTKPIELFEGSTYENKDNLEPDYIRGLEGLYHGQMFKRFVLGEWGAFEGLVYPEFNEDHHVVSDELCEKYLFTLIEAGYDVTFVEAFDHGTAVPSCYILGFVDGGGNIIALDGFYEKELSPDAINDRIRTIRKLYVPNSHSLAPIFADPSIFRRGPGSKQLVGSSLATLLHDNGRGVRTQPANNAILNGIIKVRDYLHPQNAHQNPFTGDYGAPHLYFSTKLDFVVREIVDYYWKRDVHTQEYTDEPVDRNDHAMDTLKYLLTSFPNVSKIPPRRMKTVKPYMKWHEVDSTENRRIHRHG